MLPRQIEAGHRSRPECLDRPLRNHGLLRVRLTVGRHRETELSTLSLHGPGEVRKRSVPTSIEDHLRHLQVAPLLTGHARDLLAPSSHLRVLRRDLDVLAPLRFDDPVDGLVVCILNDDEVGVVDAYCTAALQVLNMEAREPLCKLCEAVDVASTVEELREASLVVVVAGDDVEDGPVGRREMAAPGELGCLRETVGIADNL